jgi:NodT family efflux transporter outer membrane factor (OMF) lipoprotein
VQIDPQIRRAALLAALTLALGTAGCSLAPVYVRPPVGAAADWTSTRMPAEHGIAVRAGWWRSFGSPELDRLMDIALSGNLNFQAAVARIAEARGTAEIAGAPLFPSVNLAGTQDHGTGLKGGSTHELLAQASYELDFWGKNRAAAASGATLVDASSFDADTVAMTLSASLADGYFQILSLRERIRLARQIASDARRVLALIEVQRSAGTATDLQVQQQRTAIATFDAAVPALQQQMDVAIHALAVLTGQPPEGFTVEAGDLAALSRPDIVPDLPPALLERRPDIRAAEARLIAANFDIGVARAAFFPNITLTGAAGIGSTSLSHFFPPAAVTDLGVGLLQPLFQGGQLEGQLQVAQGRKLELVALYREAVLTAYQDVEDALSTLDQLRAQLAIETAANAAAQKAYELAQLQYSLGSSDYLTVLTTEQTFYGTQDTLQQLQLAQLQAVVGLCSALGGGFDHGAEPVGPTVTKAEAATRQETPAGPQGDAL